MEFNRELEDIHIKKRKTSLAMLVVNKHWMNLHGFTLSFLKAKMDKRFLLLHVKRNLINLEMMTKIDSKPD